LAELKKIQVLISGEADIVACRQVARETAGLLGFRMLDQSRITTAVSELTRNVVRYATDQKGEMVIRGIASANGDGIEIVVRDEGPGIENLDEVLREGYSSGKGLGLGLSGTKRLMDEMEIESQPGMGTVVTVRKWRR
jgi:serine/threonine-protein kinase RsbT